MHPVYVILYCFVKENVITNRGLDGKRTAGLH